ncbi:hypothetical protein MtrunA17_Chr1g0213151 [Medicago truncatula]|uniref:Transmembrane protein, putative n=1 Tax=Medicago truncatula TaxID=3880 RepID=G7IF15_MEDTR|nr:uncharacterized protein LOC11440743 [Medicago truncatula]AES63031.1 transmembrane protein, putative [Medicago truncatula]RHN82752.1 hypothetical protein MtrunA17_Chr1g0213151 [Medicago truncatula]
MLRKGKDGFWRVLEPVRVIHNNKLVLLFIALFTTLPLSFLLFTLSITTHTLRSHIYHLEALALFTSTLMEARHVWHESRDNAVYLLRIRALFLLICLPLSLAAAVSSVHTTYNFIQGKSVTVNSVVTAVKENWKRPFVTAIFVYVILFVFSSVPRVISSAFTSPELRFIIMAIGFGFEVYLMGVMGLGMVVSVVEERTGLEAITVGSDLMRGKRLIFGWLLSGLFVLVSGFMNGRVEVLLEGTNSEISVWDETILICSYGFIVVFSYVVTTVFYCYSREQQPDCISLLD